jgi:poly-beta-1,6-N-acetyl-D-glucosamine synthase
LPVQYLVLLAMLSVTLLFLLLSVIYGQLLNGFLKDWRAIPVAKPDRTPQHLGPLIRVSVLIPARNEADSIGALLSALQGQLYPSSLLEIIVIDDHSEDPTAAIVQTFDGVRLLQLEAVGINSYKKNALEKGVASATGELIVCTDADCIPGPHWIKQIVTAYSAGRTKFIAAPVLLQHQESWLGYLQALDFMVLQGITGAGIQSGALLMANGANLAYPKAVFTEVNGYRGYDQIASGDDFFLLHKISDRYPDQIVYLKSKSAIVSTAAQENWNDFFQQRIRWASKSAYYKKGGLQRVLSLVWCYNFLLLAMALGAFFDSRLLLSFLGGWLIKTMLEWSFMCEMTRFFDRPSLQKKFFWLQPLHIVYTVVAGVLGLKGRYRWKGRKVR